ncbi:hypothetical protein [Nostoc sp.]|uniref:hypothetical protein n=1 Tax=Nostoc sp. TaxID=1180 RepID=UPI002FFCDE5C
MNNLGQAITQSLNSKALNQNIFASGDRTIYWYEVGQLDIFAKECRDVKYCVSTRVSVNA